MDFDTLKACLDQAQPENIDLFLQPLNTTFDEFEINTPARQAMFLAQIGIESNYLHYVKENLNYSAQGLLSTFPKHFTSIEVPKYARNPEAIANRVYANRMGNGDEASGDGWTYRGRGLIQITGKENYSVCLDALNSDNVAYLETPDGATRSAGWFWSTHNLNRASDNLDVRKCTQIINGGLNGVEHRENLYQHICGVLGV